MTRSADDKSARFAEAANHGSSLRTLHLFAGAGGGILGGMLLGHIPVCAVEIDKYCRRVLEARQADGCLPPFPVFADVRAFDGRPWRGRVDVVAGGFPCQPWSSAGKQMGADDPRHLWPEMARIVEEVRPTYVFAENVSLAALEEPWRDLRGLGYRVPPALCVAASDVGAPHIRKRWWMLGADTDSGRRQEQRKPEPAGQQSQPWRKFIGLRAGLEFDAEAGRGDWWKAEPPVGRVVDGMADRVGQLRALGNGQVPMAAATAWHYLMEQLT